MAGRRRVQRFILTVTWEGALRVPTDVTVERRTDNEVWVVSPTPAHRNDVLTLDTTGSEPSEAMSVRVADSVPVVVDGVVRHRLRLAIVR